MCRVIPQKQRSLLNQCPSILSILEIGIQDSLLGMLQLRIMQCSCLRRTGAHHLGDRLRWATLRGDLSGQSHEASLPFALLIAAAVLMVHQLHKLPQMPLNIFTPILDSRSRSVRCALTCRCLQSLTEARLKVGRS